MNDLNDLLENTKWSDMGLDNRIRELTHQAKQIEKHDVLAPEDWNEIVVMTYDLSRLALEVMDYAIEQEKRGIGG
ncbi:hypothetical protein [Lactobacillus crispatus]|jgi:hypothetical protein|uniref:hypothetical protein n=1 Tax=Lactobacillus crispatus TaxID=47770 RepID=UPI0010610A27|nr:hypothetical protein [Lactobacillus crispatus]MBG0736902.1 hypothetical protein [Lactobacillus crispatus]MCT7680800.1 hypothetical protein [Lactobacillus crispatus]MCT7687721.1 hypothetical protein [Lactobacillus crispatus]MCZ3786341.1 hypothetical protein [Lactobacillus crispatus]MCZ3793966.1 hypothetical protein [Lactobacillus crispatus]